MTLSEEDAKTKRCQEGFGPPLYDPTQFPNGLASTCLAQPNAPQFCIASACMAWRWKYGDDRRFRREDAKHGYCGKAGKP